MPTTADASSEIGRFRPGTGFEDFLQALQAWLPPGWQSCLQMEDPLTLTLQGVATSLEPRTADLLTLAPLPEAFSERPDPWLLRRLGFERCHVFPLAGERNFGRLLLVAEGAARRLDDHRAEQIRGLCAEAVAELERARAHREDEKLYSRLRKITETELAIRLSEAILGLLPGSLATAIFGAQGDQLSLLDLRLASGERQETLLYRRSSLVGSHLAALVPTIADAAAGDDREVPALLSPRSFGRFAEGKLLGPFSERVGARRLETLPLESGERLVGSAVIFYGDSEPPFDERRAVARLAGSLAVSLDRIRPERRQASSLLYLQELIRGTRGGLDSILRTVVEELVAYMAADAGCLALVDADSGTLLLTEQEGYGHDASLPQSLPLESPPAEGAGTADSRLGGELAGSILGHVVRTGEGFVASDTRFSAIYLAVDPGVRSEIAVPLRIRGEVVGVVLASSRTPDFFRADDLKRFRLFADQVAVAVDNARLLHVLRSSREQKTVHRQRWRFGFHPSVHAHGVEYHFGNLVGNPGGAMGRVYRTIERLAAREQDIVLILGETGSGKEMVAHALHNASPRRSRPLVATNFAALGGDPNLVQSELFGHEKGSFTGAVRRRKGAFEKAHGSTLLIDELGDIGPAVQVKLLRVLGRSSRRELQRLGGEETLHADVRVLCATNKDLREEIRLGRFREDLYYRLSALMVRVPPLRERLEDVPLLVRHFLPRLADGREVRVGAGALRELQAYSFPGNVRQLESVLLRSLVMFGRAEELTGEDVRQALAVEDGGVGSLAAPVRLECPDPPPEGWFWREVQEPWKSRRLTADRVRDLLTRELELTGGFYSRVARRLGVADDDYQRFLDFLKHSGLKVDHRPYRA
ncbi:MAG: sigma 54-interacting transcriptional regulator, partial [Holophagales bacterium]|nr:sigma 54-interacting transcriptional regulator [Holophagales bacterium]